MTMGYLCDVPGCNKFTAAHPVATYEHRALLVNDEGESKPYQISAHFCDDCALHFTGNLGKLPTTYGES